MFNSVLHGETLRWLLGQLMSQDPLFVTEAHVVFTSRATSLRGLFIFSNSLEHSRGISTPQSRSNPPRIISLWLYGRVNRIVCRYAAGSIISTRLFIPYPNTLFCAQPRQVTPPQQHVGCERTVASRFNGWDALSSILNVAKQRSLVMLAAKWSSHTCSDSAAVRSESGPGIRLSWIAIWGGSWIPSERATLFAKWAARWPTWMDWWRTMRQPNGLVTYDASAGAKKLVMAAVCAANHHFFHQSSIFIPRCPPSFDV